jgi:hypothetical protein
VLLPAVLVEETLGGGATLKRRLIMAYKGWFLGHKLELVRMLPGVLAHAHLGL